MKTAPTEETLYSGVPILARMTAYLLLGSGGLVMIPLGLAHRVLWLLWSALPVLLLGAGLLLTRLRVTVAGDTGQLRVERAFLGATVRRREYPPSTAAEVMIVRVAGVEERERPTDTWYLQLNIHTVTRDLFGRVRPTVRTHLIGRYATHEEALEAHRRLASILERRTSPGTGRPADKERG